jgi:hypothetical protein
MATIRISSLPEIKVDRITDDDYYIVNDGDITTSKVSFRQIVLGIGERDIEFSGDIQFNGSVNLGDNVTGDFYNKDETYNKQEVDNIVSQLEDYDTFQDERIVPLIELTGETEKSIYFRDFPKGIIRTEATTRAALTDLELYCSDNRTLIGGSSDSINDLEGELSSLTFRVEQLEVTVGDVTSGLVKDVNELQLLTVDHEVRINQHELQIFNLRTDVDNHEVRITDLETLSTTNSDKVNALIIQSGMPTLSQDMGAFTGTGFVQDNQPTKKVLQEIVTEVDTKAPIDNPVFTTKITAPPLVANRVPVYYNDKTDFPGLTDFDYNLGEFAYSATQNAGYVSAAGRYERILSFNDDNPALYDRTFIFQLLGYPRAYITETDAAANGVSIGGTYVQSPTGQLSDGLIRTNMFSA